MLVKKFEAETIEKALSLVKESLGPDALVLSTQRKQSGRLIKRHFVEVTAAKNEKKAPEPPVDRYGFDSKTIEEVFPYRRFDLHALEQSEETERARQENENPPAEPQRNKRLGKFLGVHEIGKSEKKTNHVMSPKKGQSSNAYISRMVELGFLEETATQVARRLIFDYPRDQRQTAIGTARLMAKIIAPKLKTLDRDIFDFQPCWTAIGVAGAGKTSMTVKLGLYLRRMGTEVTLIGGDQRKLSGRRELASYAKLIGAQFSSKVVSHREGKIVQLIDSPGLVVGANNNLGELRDVCRGTNPVLVLDANMRLKEMMRIVEATATLSPSAVAFTRLDIAGQRGSIYDFLKETSLPLMGMSVSGSYRVPFKFFDVKELASFLVQDRTLV